MLLYKIVPIGRPICINQMITELTCFYILLNKHNIVLAEHDNKDT